MNTSIVLKTWFQTVILGSLILFLVVALFFEAMIGFTSFNNLSTLGTDIIHLIGYSLYFVGICSICSVPSLIFLCFVANQVKQKTNAFETYTVFYFIASIITFTLLTIVFRDIASFLIYLCFYYTFLGFGVTMYSARSIGFDDKQTLKKHPY